MYPPTFEEKAFSLKAYTSQDEERFVEIMRDPKTREFMNGENETETYVRNLFQQVFDIYKNKDSKKWHWCWGIYKDDVLAGLVALKETHHTTKEELEIVYVIHPEFRRTGLMTKVLFFLGSKQEEWKRKIIATVKPRNKVSLQVLEKWGIKRKELIKNDPEDYHKIQLR